MAETDAFLPESLPVFRDGVTLHAGLVSGRTFTAKFGLDPFLYGRSLYSFKYILKYSMIALRHIFRFGVEK